MRTNTLQYAFLALILSCDNSKDGSSEIEDLRAVCPNEQSVYQDEDCAAAVEEHCGSRSSASDCEDPELTAGLDFRCMWQRAVTFDDPSMCNVLEVTGRCVGGVRQDAGCSDPCDVANLPPDYDPQQGYFWWTDGASELALPLCDDGGRLDGPIRPSGGPTGGSCEPGFVEHPDICQCGPSVCEALGTDGA